MKKIREFIIVFVGFTLLTLILTYPAVFRLSTHFMGDSGDAFQNVWNMWWLKKALMELFTNPYYTKYLHYPNGVTLLFHTLNPFNGLISIPFQYFFRMETVYNLVVLFSFIMSGVGMYYLAFYITNHKLSALIAGIIYTFCPYHFAHGLGNLNLIAMEWIPFYVLYLIKTYQQESFRYAVFAGFFLILVTLCSWYYLVYCLFFTTIFLVYHLYTDRTKFIRFNTFFHLSIILFVFSLFMSPLLYSMVSLTLTESFTGGHNPINMAADLTSFFIPGYISIWGRMWFTDIWSQWRAVAAEHTNYLGYIVLGLSIYALIRIPKCRFWGITGAIFWLLALGPYPLVMGHLIRIPLPYLFFHKYFPFFSFTGFPARFDIMIIFCMAILAAYALRNLTRDLHKKKLFVSIVGIIICVEYLAVPIHTTKIDVPMFYRQIASDAEDYGIIDIPSNSLTLYYATIHKKPIVGGYISRTPATALRFLKEFRVTASTLSKYNIRYIVIHNETYPKLRAYLEDKMNLRKVYDREGIKVFEYLP